MPRILHERTSIVGLVASVHQMIRCGHFRFEEMDSFEVNKAVDSVWGLPEEQTEHECVVITPRYERTTMNDYWEHTYDLENTYKLVEFMLSNKWNFGNPNREDRADKVLKIDPKKVYTTGWSMGAMSSLWMMANTPTPLRPGSLSQANSDLLMLWVSRNRMRSSSPANWTIKRLLGMKSVFRSGSMQVVRSPDLQNFSTRHSSFRSTTRRG
jgi:hypothetical protein